jgi:hypothetical protein
VPQVLKPNAIPNVHGNAMILIVQQYVIQSVNPLNVTLHALNQETQFAMLNVKNLNAKLNAQTKDVKCLTAQNA